MAPEFLTIGISAAANPPAIGSSGFACATRLETTTTLTEPPFSYPCRQPLRSRFVFPLVVQCSGKAREFERMPHSGDTVELLRVYWQIFRSKCCTATMNSRLGIGRR